MKKSCRLACLTLPRKQIGIRKNVLVLCQEKPHAANERKLKVWQVFNKTTIANKTFPILLLGCHGSVRIFIVSVCYCSHFSFIIQIHFDFPCIFLKQVVQEENTQYFLEKKKLKETVKQLTDAVGVPRLFLFIFALKHNFMSQDFSFTHTITIFDFCLLPCLP